MHCHWVIIFLCGFVQGLTFKDLYPYGDQAGDTAIDKGRSPYIAISTLLPFFNHQHSGLRIDTSGIIFFLQPVGSHIPDPFPIPDDVKIIMPFWAHVDISKGGTVWYRETTQEDILDRATEEIRSYFPDFYKFKASWVFIATWYRVAYFGCHYASCFLQTNTFQAVLITNGQHSFTIFNFEDIKWTTGTANGGDGGTGLGGTPAQSGFYAGDGGVFFPVNGSNTPDIVNVDEYSNVEIPGKFAFRIDSRDISDGGCNTEGNLTVVPRYGPMLGGQYVVISGPCIDPNATIKASFFGLPKETCDRKSEFAIVCITPMFKQTGEARVMVEITNPDRSKYTFQGLYTVLNPADCRHTVYRHNPDEWLFKKQKISWDPDVAELKDHDFVDIQLFFLAGNKGNLQWKFKDLKKNVARVQKTAKVKLRSRGKYYAMALRVAATTERSDQPRRGIWSDVFAAALPPDKAQQLCQDWLNAEKALLPIPSQDIQPCPCNLDQALLDIVRFQPDPDCNMFGKTSKFYRTGNCLNRRDARHCIRMSTVGPSGVDNLCCYDVNNNLIDSRLKEGGSLQRYHYLGGPGFQPYLSNFYYDVLPFLHCCRYSQEKDANNTNDGLCLQYMKHRKVSSCQNYEPPRLARTNGDPHITTLDGYSYTFNGVGEFWYLKTLDEAFQSQIRFEQFRNENGNLVDASVCTAVVSQHSSSSGSVVVEVRLNSIRTADLLVNGDIIDFDETNVYQFPGISIVQMSKHQLDIAKARREFIISFTEIGIAFKAIASSTVLSIIPVVGNKTLAGSLRGLLGDFDENPDNDLQTPSGEILPTNSTSERIHYDFGMLWKTTENISLFSYEAGKSYNDYQVLGFRPKFISPTNFSPETIKVCGTNRECAYDFTLTDSAEFAMETFEFSVTFNASLTATIQIQTCGGLPFIDGGYWNATNTLEGANASLLCFNGYEPIGKNEIIHCSNGNWDELGDIRCVLVGSMDPPDKMDINKSDESTRHRYVIIISAVVSFVIIHLIAVVLFYRWCKKKNEDFQGDTVVQNKTDEDINL